MLSIFKRIKSNTFITEMIWNLLFIKVCCWQKNWPNFTRMILVLFDILCLELSHQARSGSFMCVIVISTALSHVDFATICKHAKHALIRFYTGCVGLQIFDLRYNYIFSFWYIFVQKCIWNSRFWDFTCCTLEFSLELY